MTSTRTTGARRAKDPETGLFITKLTPELIAAFASDIERGCAPETACVRSGVSASTFRQWLATGRNWLEDNPVSDTPTIEAEFYAAVGKALAESKFRLETKAHSARDTREAVEVLQRRWPREWGKTDHLEIGMQDPRLALLVPLLKDRGLDPSRLSPEKLDLFIDLCIEMAPDQGAVVDAPRRALDA